MSSSEPASWRKVPIQLAVAAAVVTGIGGVIAGAAIADDDDTVELAAAGGSQTERASIRIHDRERARLGAIVAKMPSGWPATEVMRQAAEQPLGDAAAHHDWRQTVELMPSGWPATEVMRRAAAEAG